MAYTDKKWKGGKKSYYRKPIPQIRDGTWWDHLPVEVKQKFLDEKLGYPTGMAYIPWGKLDEKVQQEIKDLRPRYYNPALVNQVQDYWTTIRLYPDNPNMAEINKEFLARYAWSISSMAQREAILQESKQDDPGLAWLNWNDIPDYIQFDIMNRVVSFAQDKAILMDPMILGKGPWDKDFVPSWWSKLE